LDVCGCYAHLLAILGRFSEAETIIKHGAATNPLSSQIEVVYGLLKDFQRQYPVAISHYRRALGLHAEPNCVNQLISFSYSKAGQYPEALAALDRSELRDSAEVARIYALQGRRDDAMNLLRSVLKDRRYVYRIEIAVVYFALGDKDQGFEWLK